MGSSFLPRRSLSSETSVDCLNLGRAGRPQERSCQSGCQRSRDGRTEEETILVKIGARKDSEQVIFISSWDKDQVSSLAEPARKLAVIGGPLPLQLHFFQPK